MKKHSPAATAEQSPRLTRRQALKVGGYGLGLGVGVGQLAFGAQGCGPMPNRCGGGPLEPEVQVTPLLSAVDHIVVVMMENRSFDHYLGGLCMDASYPCARALDGLTGNEENPDADGVMVRTTRLAGNGSLNPLHSWDVSRQTFNDGRNDGFVRANAGDHQDEAISYLGREHIPFSLALADQSVVCDRWFSSVMGPTWPNRFYVHAATSQGRRRNQPMGLGAPDTIWERLADRCYTGKNYYAGGIPWYSVAFPTKSFSGNDPMTPEPMEAFFRDAASGDLPHFALIDPDFQLNDGHPPHDLGLSEAFISSVHRALANGPNWARTLLVVTFDEHGGFYDHVPPPLTTDPNPDFCQLGFRVPAIVTGPLARVGAVVSTPFDHVSIAATLRARFGIESLGPRMDAASDLSVCIDPERAAEALSTSTPTARALMLPAVELDGSVMRHGALHGTSQPELEHFARAGGVPEAHVDRRAPLERVRSWLRHAQELEAVRVV